MDDSLDYIEEIDQALKSPENPILDPEQLGKRQKVSRATALLHCIAVFFSKSKQTIVNLINLISVGVVLVASASLFIVLSAFTGLKSFGLSFSNAFDPDARVEAVLGKRLVVDSLQLAQISALEGVAMASPILEDKVFLTYRNKSQVGLLRGVKENYKRTHRH